MQIIKEFKEFVNRGNVMDLAVAVIIGSAFQNIVNSIVNDLIMPLIAVVGGWAKLDDLRFGPFNYGKLIANILHFLIVAFVLFLVVNLCTAKQMTNFRAAGKDDNTVLAPPREFSLEEAMEYIQEDEYVEVTPDNIRLRKVFLDENERKRSSSKMGLEA